MNAIERCDALENELLRRIGKIYSEAMVDALKRKKAFLQIIRDIDSGKIKPPQYYVDRDEVKKWREGYVRQLIREHNIIEGIMEELDKAGAKAAVAVQSVNPEYYAINREEAVRTLEKGAKTNGMDGTLRKMTREQVKIIITDEMPPMTRIAYANLAHSTAVRNRLQNELAKATILGESQGKLISRIRDVTGQAIWQARRIAQTERTRVQSQARWQAGNEAMALGVRVANEWSARMVNTRDTHAALDGKWALQGEYFPGSPLRYPGDPSAPASEVINCHCVLIPDVLLEGQKIVEGKKVG